jgi:O-antigen/teichoic acid export membrane protein
VAAQPDAPSLVLARSLSGIGTHPLSQRIGRSRLLHPAVAVGRVMVMRSMSLGLNAVTGILTAAELGPGGRGEQAALLIGPQVLAAFATMGLHASLIYNVNADAEHERDYVGTNILLTLAISLVASAIGWWIEPLWLANYSGTDIRFGRILILTTPFIMVSYTLIASFEARRQFVRASQPPNIIALGALIGLLGLIVCGRLTPVTAAAAYAVPSVVVFFFLFVQILREVRPRFALNPILAGRLLRRGLSFYGIDFVGATSAYLDQMVIAATLTPWALGLYAVAFNIARLSSVIGISAARVLFPNVAGKPTGAIVEQVARRFCMFIPLQMVAAFGLGLICPYLLRWFYGPEFEPAAGVLRLLVVVLLISACVGLIYQTYAGSGRASIITVIEACGITLALGAMLLLAPSLGLPGVALALLLGGLLRLSLALAGLPFILHVPLAQLVRDARALIGGGPR